MAKIAPSGRLVHQSTLLQMFKDTGYEAAILSGRARAGKPFKDRPGPDHQPPGTRSQFVPYSLFGHTIAFCHQYLLSDGTFGASGKPDPKILEYQGYRFFCHAANCDCPICQSPAEDWRAVLEELKRLKSG
jgi:hypothetical protein